MKKRLLAVLMSLCMAITFAACSSNDNSNDNSNNTNTSVEVGSLIDIGTYSEEPIEWVVVNSPSDSTLCDLLSTQVLYNSTYILDDNDSTQGSDLLKDMNEGFSSGVFSEEEMNALGHWYFNDEDSGYCLAIPNSSDIEGLFAENGDRKAIDLSGKKATWWLEDKTWVDKDGTIQEDSDPYQKEGRIAGVRPIICADKEYVASHLKDGVYSSENYTPTYSAYDTSNKKFTATVSQIQEDFANNSLDLYGQGGALFGVDPDSEYAEFEESNFAGTATFTVSYVKDEATLIEASKMSETVPDIIWLNAMPSSSLDAETAVRISVEFVSSMLATLDPDLSTEEAYDLLVDDLGSNFSSTDPNYTSEINGIPIYLSVDDGIVYVELNNNNR